MNLFGRDQARLTRAVLKLTAIVESMLQGALSALREADPHKARRVIRRDEIVDRREVAIETECLRLLALYDPLAGDLRWVAAVMKINHELERLGDLAAGIARRALGRADDPNPLPVPEDLEQMGQQALAMVRQSLEAFAAASAEEARLVITSDDEVDRLHDQIIETLAHRLRADPDRIASGLALFAVASQLERVADHATNIAEEVVFLKEGAIIRHGRRPSAPAPPMAVALQ